ncbi:hypothetical protein GMD78_11345 [Ornithinibacillus sp. L9]|uniref:ABC-2 family transporter protein n=1 Tax=Ornithinibacillus caprae TaxID=2678566 RepID=A0A6N8FNK4_9BACI|nr:ABC-2 transporter permease [Ornithinibacillus caprae]MUK88968.1 hypothetical protein [Ornithinibacillus caprae]
MISLIKRDILISKAALTTAVFLIPIAYFITIPPIYTSVGLILPVLIVGIFFLDHRAQMNKFIKSLPVLEKQIVQSRFLGIFLLWVSVVFYQFLVGNIIGAISSTPRYIYDWIDILTVICLGLMMKALFIPIYYFFKSFTTASTLIFILYMGILYSSFSPLIDILGMDDYILFNDLDQGIVPLVETYIPTYPFFVLALGSISIYFLSMKLSQRIFVNKDY